MRARESRGGRGKKTEKERERDGEEVGKAGEAAHHVAPLPTAAGGRYRKGVREL